MEWIRIAEGDYESSDGRYIMQRLIGVNPPAWNVEDAETCELLVDGAATMRDAIALAEQAIGGSR